MKALLAAALIFAPTLDAMLDEARVAAKKGDNEAALKLADAAVTAYPKDAQAYRFRGGLQLTMNHHTEAIADFTASLKLDPKQASVYDWRGSELYRLGRVKEALADFDEYLKLKPDEAPKHWKRGIALYDLGRFDEGRKQFAGYEKVDTNDVENSVWHYLCNVRVVGRDKARAEMLKIGNDKRVPMMVVFKLFKGDAKPADVHNAAEADKVSDQQRKLRRFYAHLYLGLYYESEGDKKQALEHLSKAVTTYRVDGYMADVAQVRRDRLAAK